MANTNSEVTTTITQPILLRKIVTLSYIVVSIFILPFYIHNQIITGSFVNAGLLVSMSSFGLPTAIVLAIVPSLIALGRGLLPIGFVSILPFIMISNILYIVVFNSVKAKKTLAVIIASFLKFGLLFMVSQFLLSHIVVSNLFQKASLMLGWFQLVTSLIGGVIAIASIRVLNGGTRK